MPDVRNFTHGAPPEKQNSDGMFRWARNSSGDPVLCSGDEGIARVWRDKDGIIRAEVYSTTPMPWVVDPLPWKAPPHKSIKDAKRLVEAWWRAAANTAKELGLCEPEADPVPCFAVKDSAGRDHVYVTPEKAVQFRIASDGSLRDAVDADGNPVEIRKAKEAGL